MEPATAAAAEAMAFVNYARKELVQLERVGLGMCIMDDSAPEPQLTAEGLPCSFNEASEPQSGDSAEPQPAAEAPEPRPVSG